MLLLVWGSLAALDRLTCSVTPLRLQEVLHDEVGPPFDLAALRGFAAAQLMEENIDFLVEVKDETTVYHYRL